MFGKVFGGPLVHLVEHHQGQLVFLAKKPLVVDKECALKVAGQLAKPAKIKGLITAARALDSGGFLCTATVQDLAHQRELNRLGVFSITPVPGLRQEPRICRSVPIESPDLALTSVDISSGGMQVETPVDMSPGDVLKLRLMPGLNCDARVAWSGPGRAGLSFCETDDATRSLLSHFASGRTLPTAKKSFSQSKFMAPPSYETLD